MKIIKDTLQHNGKYSRKSLTAFGLMAIAVVSEFVLPFMGITPNDYVFITSIGMCCGTLGLTVWDKKSNQNQEI